MVEYSYSHHAQSFCEIFKGVFLQKASLKEGEDGEIFGGDDGTICGELTGFYGFVGSVVIAATAYSKVMAGCDIKEEG